MQPAPPGSEPAQTLSRSELDSPRIPQSEPAVAGRTRRTHVRRLLLASDLVALALAIVAAEVVLRLHGPFELSGTHGVVVTTSALAIIAALAMCGLYARDDVHIDHQTPDEMRTIVGVLVGVGFVLLAIGAAWRWDHAASIAAVTGVLVGAGGIPAARAVARTAARRDPAYTQRALILGAGHVGQLVARKLLEHPEYGIEPVGFVDDAPRPRPNDLAFVPVLGSTADAITLIRARRVDRVIVAFSSNPHHEALAAVTALRAEGIRVDVVPRLYEAMGPYIHGATIEGLTTITLSPLQPPRSALALKRLIDVVVAGTVLVVGAPLLALIALAIRIDSRGAVIYRGERIGRGGRTFSQLKFRTMRHEVSAGHAYGGDAAMEYFDTLLSDVRLREEFKRTQKLQSDPRVTRVGRWLRRTSLDELPQLWNVLVGDLSLVGPRPITERERIERYGGDPDLSRRPLGYWDLEAFRPGMTGYWQISGRSQMSFEERIRLDTAYLTGWSLGLDINILAKTLRSVVMTSGAY